jgi:prolipoprotein diacylglyceryltransferase
VQWTGNPRVHLAFEILGYVCGAAIYATARARRGDPIPDRARATVIAAAGIGAALGMRLLYALSYPGANPLSGKTVVGGLLGGLAGVEIVKRFIGISRSTGDLFVYPSIAAIAIGRIGCFLTGPVDRTAGLPTTLPWGIAIADAVPRHPVALYEIAFLLLLAPLVRLATRDGDRFKIFLSSYLLFRLLVDFLKPDPPPVAGGLSAIQWACVAGLAYYSIVFLKRASTNDDRNTALPLL